MLNGIIGLIKQRSLSHILALVCKGHNNLLHQYTGIELGILQARVNAEMEKRNKEEHDALASKLEAEARKEERALSAKSDESREIALREKKNKQAAELAARKDLSQDEVAAVSLIES